jgi:antitoxin component of MazEF toxin-antitoxin module
MSVGETVRKINKVGGSLFITIPEEFAKEHGLAKGDSVRVTFDHLLYVEPISKDKLSQKLEAAREILTKEE